MFQVKNLCKSIKGKKILDKVSFEQDHGTIGVFLGPSGVGKSTLLRCLNNLETLDAGEMWLDNQQLDTRKLHEQHLMSMVFQNFELFNHLSSLDNIKVALKYALGKSNSEADTIARSLLKKYHLKDQEKSYPAQLSGGQKQRLAIARVVAIQPKIICLDEPTSALDSRLRGELKDHIYDLKKEGYIVLLTTHDLAFVQTLEANVYEMQAGNLSFATH